MFTSLLINNPADCPNICLAGSGIPGAGFLTSCPCGVWGPGLITCPLYDGIIFGKSILIKLACTLDKMEKQIFLSM